MANVLANIARVESLTTGPGTLTLGSAIAGFNLFAAAGITNGQTVTYAIEDYNAAGTAVTQREVGSGVYTAAGTTLTRNVYSSTNAGAAISCSGRQHVFITAAKEDFDTFLTTVAASAAYQPLDSDLTTIAANITAFGHSLIDDAAASNARTTLELGTAAIKNTGTSGDAVPLLDVSNTWSAQQIISVATLISNIVATSTDSGAGGGPYLAVRRTSSSPAAADGLGGFIFQGQDSAGVQTNYAALAAVIVSPTSPGSQGGRIDYQTTVAGTFATRAKIYDGMRVGDPTGGDKGLGTLNAVGVYDDDVLLCAGVELIKSGKVSPALWDTFTVPHDIDGGVREKPVMVETDEDVTHLKPDVDGTYIQIKSKRRVQVMDLVPVYDEKGNGIDAVEIPRIERTVVPPRRIVPKNELAHELKVMIDGGFDPRDPKAYFDKMLADEALPGLKTKANWVPNDESNAKRTNRVILALELQTAVIKTLYERIEALENKVKP